MLVLVVWYSYEMSGQCIIIYIYVYLCTKCFPLNADAFRGVFHGLVLGKDCTLPRIHVYGFSKAQDPEFDFHEV